MLATRKIKNFDTIPLPAKVLTGEWSLSQTLINAFCQCPRQFMFMLDRWEQPGKEINTFFGTVVHEMLDKCTGHGKEEILESLPKLVHTYISDKSTKRELEWLTPSECAYQEGIILVVLEEYYEYYGDELDKDVVMCETKFDLRYRPSSKMAITGKIDRVERDKRGFICIDHKTAGEISEDEKLLSLPLNFQLKFYSHAVNVLTGEIPTRFRHNMIRRPKHKPKYNEKLPTFLNRLREEIKANPAHFFMRFECEFTQADYKAFMAELDIKMDAIESLCAGKTKAIHNEAFCVGTYKCPYLMACSTNSLAYYKQRKYISPELI